MKLTVAGRIYNRCLLNICTLVLLFTSFNTSALPSFTRQTGVACNQCHTQSFGPNLTPFGRSFKLNGYVQGGASGLAEKLPPLSGIVQGTFTHTDKGQDGLPAEFNKNDNFTFDQASLFYAGRIYGKTGAFSQLTYDGVAHAVALDNTDIRYADQLDLDDLQLSYGISLNNNPTVQDLWNSTPAWGFPFNGSALQPAPGATAIIDGVLGSQVGGATAYALINDLVYLEAGAYDSFSTSFQRSFGIGAADRIRLDGPAPYWRVALQKNWQGHYFSVGHYGLKASLFPGRDASEGADRYTDVAFDANYQYLGNLKHIFEVRTTFIYEDQNLAPARSSGVNTYLNTFKFNTAYTYEQTYGVTFAYNKIDGSNDSAIYANNRPNSEYLTAELVYVPFGKSTSTSLLGSLLNLRMSLQYIGYTQFDNVGQSANANNTFMLNGWLAF
ncbi:MAG: cytochrome C [Methylococcaceae bacterium]|jgi:hypothetical protein